MKQKRYTEARILGFLKEAEFGFGWRTAPGLPSQRLPASWRLTELPTGKFNDGTCAC
jgi:hypothetical protein